jgi:hypothetical protein
MILCVISMFIYVCQCIGLRNIVILMYMYLTMLYPINDLNLNLNIASVSYRRQAVYWSVTVYSKYIFL